MKQNSFLSPYFNSKILIFLIRIRLSFGIHEKNTNDSANAFSLNIFLPKLRSTIHPEEIEKFGCEIKLEVCKRRLLFKDHRNLKSPPLRSANISAENETKVPKRVSKYFHLLRSSALCFTCAFNLLTCLVVGCGFKTERKRPYTNKRKCGTSTKVVHLESFRSMQNLPIRRLISSRKDFLARIRK